MELSLFWIIWIYIGDGIVIHDTHMNVCVYAYIYINIYNKLSPVRGSGNGSKAILFPLSLLGG